MINIDYYINKLDEFPTLPTIYSMLLEVMSDPNSSIQDISDVIMKDQSSTIKILRAANMSIYGLQDRVTSLNQAIFFLGINEIKNIILSISVIDILSNIKSYSSFNIIDFWKHSIGVGVISRHIAKLFGIKDLDNYFIAGIIHDIGKLFFLKFMREDYLFVLNSVLKSKKVLLKDAEFKVFGMDHCSVGELIADKWKLPKLFKDSIRYHETGMPKGKSDIFITCIHLANIVARIMDFGYPGDNLIPQPNFDIWDGLNIPHNAFSELHDVILADFKQSINVLLLNN